MPRKRQLRPDAEIAVYRTAEPVLVNGGQTVKSLSAAFLADLEDDWRQHGKQIFSVLRDKYPQAYFGGLVALSKVIRWEVGVAGEFDRSLTPEEIMDRLEKRVGPEGRKLFEQFLRKVNKLQMQQHLEARAQGDTERWEVGVAGEFDRSLTPEEIMDRLEKRVGPEGRKLFEQFLRKVNKLQMQQHLEARAQGDTERSRERGPG